MIAEHSRITASELHVLVQALDGFVRRTQGVSLEDVHCSARGGSHVVFARHLWMYLVHALLGTSLTRTAALVTRDRRMVAYATARIEQRREDDPTFDRLVGLYQAAADRLAHDTLARLRLRLAPDATSLTPPKDRHE